MDFFNSEIGVSKLTSHKWECKIGHFRHVELTVNF